MKNLLAVIGIVTLGVLLFKFCAAVFVIMMFSGKGPIAAIAMIFGL